LKGAERDGECGQARDGLAKVERVCGHRWPSELITPPLGLLSEKEEDILGRLRVDELQVASRGDVDA
tara:strand:- start:20 stop:220 length:201 start_codon:yes stop_codon:yes gene_type:complete